MQPTITSKLETHVLLFELDNELSTLEMYFQKCEVQFDKDDHNADEHLVEGEYWEFKEPHRVEAWSLFMIPFTNEMTLSYKFKGAEVYLQISFQTKIKDVEADMNPVIKIKCMTTIPDIDKKDQYHFAVYIDSVLISFNLSLFLESLDPMPYRSEIKELEKKLDNNEWKNANDTPLTWKKLCNKIRHLFTDIHTPKGKLAKQDEISNLGRSQKMAQIQAKIIVRDPELHRSLAAVGDMEIHKHRLREPRSKKEEIFRPSNTTDATNKGLRGFRGHSRKLRGRIGKCSTLTSNG